MNKIMVLVVILAILLLTHTQKIEVNDKQLSTATPYSCSWMGMSYDTSLKTCIGEKNETVQGQEG